MKAKFGREIALLTLPVFILGGVALWNGKMKSWSGFGAPWGLYEGKPRLEITDWQKETPSALDFGRGISSRWTVTTWHGGTCPVTGKPPLYGGVTYPKNLYFAWKRAGRWNRTPFRYGSSELDVMDLGRRVKPTSIEVRLGLPMDLVPKDAEEVRLRGHLEGWMRCQSVSATFPSAPLDISLKREGEKWPTFAGSHVPSLKLQSVQQEWAPQYSNVKGPITRWLVRATFASLRKGERMNFWAENTTITDAKGGDLKGGSFEIWRGEVNGTKPLEWEVDATRLKGHPRPFIIKSWVFARKGELPLRVSIPLTLDRLSAPVR